MSIKPIDLQTNLGQLHEIARNQQVKSEAVIGQQQSLDKESEKKSTLNKSRLEENKKAEKDKVRPDDQKSNNFRHQKQKQDDDMNNDNKNKKFVEDPNLGRLIDIKK